jgi:predicted nucleic acid-binding protein
MILVDTNVVSELMRPEPASVVVRWFARQTLETLFLSAVSEAELRTGVLLMPSGQKRDRIASAVENMLFQLFTGRVLAFDQTCARPYAEFIANRRSLGRPVSVQDAQIAATAEANAIPLATRNLRDFELVGLTLIDPWTAD